jgi:hypothetical protein
MIDLTEEHIAARELRSAAYHEAAHKAVTSGLAAPETR